MTPGVLVVSDVRFLREGVRAALHSAGCEPVTTATGADAATALEDGGLGALVLDMELGSADPVELVRRVATARPELSAILLAGHAAQPRVLEALRLGADDYLAKPIHDEELRLCVRRGLAHYEQARDAERWRRAQGDAAPPEPPRGDDAPDLAELARAVCDAATAGLAPEDLLAGVLRPIEEALGCAPVSLYLRDASGSDLVCEAQRDAGRRADRARLPGGRGLTGTVLASGAIVATADPASDPRFDPAVDTPEDGVAGPVLCGPLRFRERPIGVFRAFASDDAAPSLRTGEVLAATLSAAVRSALLYRSVVANIEELARARREGPPPH